MRDDIRLLATEMLSNAIRHTRSGEGGGTLTLTVLDLGHATRVEVIDQGCSTDPSPLRGGMQQDSEEGYGLRLLTLLATRWEALAWGEGSKTWFEI
jgi:anti-sigma regulatory factor (Ser/Thr protein kinase)